MKKVFLYVRVSTQEQANEGYSVKEQEERLRAYAKAHGYIVVKVFIDPGYSGSNLNRPAIQDMISNIKEIDAVIVHKLDRLSRSQKDTLHLIEDIFLKNSVDFISLTESIDTSTPFGRAMIGILSAFAQLEREQIAERMWMGKVARAKAGHWHGGDPSRTVTGYNYIQGELVVNEYEAECVRYIFDEYIKGKGYRTIYEEITEKFPGIIASSSTIKRILKRPVYKGLVVFGQKEYKGNHEAIITDEQFDEAQFLMEKRSVKFDSSPKSMYILSGLLNCGLCNAKMAGKSGSRAPNGEKRKYYVCYTRRKMPKYMMTADNCSQRFHRKETIEKVIIDELKKINLKSIEMPSDKNDKKDRISILKKEVQKIDNQIAKTVDLFSLDSIPINILNDKIEKLNESKGKLMKHINDLNEDSSIDNEKIKEAISRIPEIDNMELVKQHSIIATLIDNITVYDDRVDIDWIFER